MRPLVLALASTLALAACTATDAGLPTTASNAAMPTDRAAYVAQAAASDLYEIQSSQLAVSKAQRADVREFAQMLITHHQQTTAALTAAAQASGMTPPPPMLMPMQAAMIEELQNAPSEAFDQAYLRQQVPAHEMALALHQNYAARGDTPQLRTAATSAVPIVRGHLDRARTLD